MPQGQRRGDPKEDGVMEVLESPSRHTQSKPEIFQGGNVRVAPWMEGVVVPTFVKELLAGGVAGGAAKTAVAPFERCKILFQTGNNQGGVLRTISQIYNAKGIKGLYKGNGAMVVRVVPYAAFHFMAYEQYKRAIQDAQWIHPSPMVDLLAGSAAGATAVMFTYPLDLVRTRLAWQGSEIPTAAAKKVGFQEMYRAARQGGPGATVVPPPREYRGIVDALRTISATEGGVYGLYRGIGPTLLGILPYAGLKFYFYESLKLEHVQVTGQQPALTHKLFYGATCGLIAQTATYPLDVVRRNMQVQGAAEGDRYRSTLDGFRKIMRANGWRRFFSGLSLNYLKVVPSTAIGFTLYDTIKSHLGVVPRGAG